MFGFSRPMHRRAVARAQLSRFIRPISTRARLGQQLASAQSAIRQDSFPRGKAHEHQIQASSLVGLPPAVTRVQKLERTTSSEDGSDILRVELAVTERSDFWLANDGGHRSTNHQSSAKVVDIPGRWLLDHCQSERAVDTVTRQRIIDVLDQNDEASKFELQAAPDGFEVVFTKTGHRSVFSNSWLIQMLDMGAQYARMQGQAESFQRWTSFSDANTSKQNAPEVAYDRIMTTQEGLAEWTRKIKEFGFCFATGTPVDEVATEKLIERIGPLINTHYGQFHRMTSDLSSKDSAYTTAALPPHNDTTYFSHPIGLQMLHLMEHTTSASGEAATGGESILVDGIAVAKHLRDHNPTAFKALATIPVFAHASGNEGISLQGAEPRPVIGVDATTKEITQIRWNPADRAYLAISMDDFLRESNEWYTAAAEFQRLLHEDDRFRYTFQLEPGKPVMFDNWRALHGRGAFTGKRSMCGGYVDRDYFVSTYKMGNMGGPTL